MSSALSPRYLAPPSFTFDDSVKKPSRIGTTIRLGISQTRMETSAAVIRPSPPPSSRKPLLVVTCKAQRGNRFEFVRTVAGWQLFPVDNRALNENGRAEPSPPTSVAHADDAIARSSIRLRRTCRNGRARLSAMNEDWAWFRRMIVR
jgi:hypothetical protein